MNKAKIENLRYEWTQVWLSENFTVDDACEESLNIRWSSGWGDRFWQSYDSREAFDKAIQDAYAGMEEWVERAVAAEIQRRKDAKKADLASRNTLGNLFPELAAIRAKLLG